MWCHLVIIEIHRRHLLYPGPLLNNLNFSFQIIEDQEKQSGQYSILTNFSPSSQMFSIFHISPKYWSVLAPIKKIWTSKGVVSRMRFNFSFNFFFYENRTCVPAAGRRLFSFKDLLHYRSEPAVFWFSSSLSLQHQSTDHQQQSRCTSKIIKTLSGLAWKSCFGCCLIVKTRGYICVLQSMRNTVSSPHAGVV